MRFGIAPTALHRLRVSNLCPETVCAAAVRPPEPALRRIPVSRSGRAATIYRCALYRLVVPGDAAVTAINIKGHAFLLRVANSAAVILSPGSLRCCFRQSSCRHSSANYHLQYG